VHETTTFLLVTLPNIRAALGTEFLSLYPPHTHTHGDPIHTAEFRAAVGTEFLSPHPPHTHTYTHGDPHGDSHTHGRPAKYSPMLLQLLLFKDVVVRFPVGIAMRGERHCVSSAVFIFSTFELLQRDFLTTTTITLLELPADSKYRVAFYKFLHVM